LFDEYNNLYTFKKRKKNYLYKKKSIGEIFKNKKCEKDVYLKKKRNPFVNNYASAKKKKFL